MYWQFLAFRKMIHNLFQLFQFLLCPFFKITQTCNRSLLQAFVKIFKLVRLVIFGSFLPYLSRTLFVYWDLHVVQESDVAPKAQIEKISVHLFEIGRLIDVSARVVVEYFNQSKFYFLGIISWLLFFNLLYA